MPEYTRLHRRKAVLVEDEFLVALHVQELLEELSFEVVGPVARLSEAVRLCRHEQGLDLGILDVNLGGEMSWPAARALRCQGVPFLFMSGYIEVHAQLPSDLAGYRLMGKPVDPEELSQAIGILIGVPPSPGASSC